MMSKSEKEKFMAAEQLTLPFDFYEEEKQNKLNALPYFPFPKNDNEELFNLQHDYYGGDQEALSKMFEKLEKIAPRLVNIESKKRELHLPKQRMTEVGEEAVMIFMECVLKRNLVVKKSFIAYLRLQVLRALFYYTKSMQFEKWLKDNKISIFSMSEFDAQWYKELFEKQCEEARKEKEEGK